MASGDRIHIQGAGIGGPENYDADFQWDAATASFRLIPNSVAVSNIAGMPYCPTMRFVDTTDGDGTTRIYLTVEMLVDSWSRNIQLTLTHQSSGNAASEYPAFTFHPARLRLVQSGHIYTLDDISSSSNPHFVAGNGWLPNLDPLSQGNYMTTARIVDFPVGFDLTRAFYVYYGSGSPSAPAANGNDTYYYCTTN